MLGANHLLSLPSFPAQTAALAKPYASDKTMTHATEPASTPAWVPWAVGATIGGVVLYFLVR